MHLHPNRPRFRKQHSETARGFTLVELLVVISIVAALAAVVLFMTRSVRNKAQQANALSALRQIAGASVAYSVENNGDINTLRWDTEKGLTESRKGRYVGDSFWGRLQPYIFGDISIPDQKNLAKELNMRLDSLFSTPDADTMAGTFLKGAKIYHDGSALPVPVAFNKNLHKWGEYLKVSTFSDPTRVVYATYGFGFFNESDGQSYAKIPANNSIPANKIYYTDQRQAIMTFLDGHVEMLSPPIPVRLYK